MCDEARHYPRITNFRGETILKPEGVCGAWVPDQLALSIAEVTCPECKEYIAKYGAILIKFPGNIRRADSHPLSAMA